MKNYVGLFLLCCVLPVFVSCKKVFRKDESLPLSQVTVKTVLKNHTSGIDYRIGGLLEVKAELIIEAGVEIGMESGAEIIVTDSATLKATGTSGEKIIFRPAEKDGTWTGILIRSKNASTLDHVKIEGASERFWNRGAVEVVDGAKLSMGNTEVLGSGSSSAIAADRGAFCTLLPGCYFHFNFAPIQMEPGAKIEISAGSTFTGNSKDMIYLSGRNGAAMFVYNDAVLSKLALPFLASGSIFLQKGTLQIDRGVHIQFRQRHGFFCMTSQGRLMFNGAKEDPILLTNENEAWKPKTPTWYGIEVNAGYASLRHTTISDVSNSYTGAVTVSGSGELDMASCTMVNFTGKCSIMKVGKMSRVNAGIASSNSYVKSPGYCEN